MGERMADVLWAVKCLAILWLVLVVGTLFLFSAWFACTVIAHALVRAVGME